MPIAIQNYIFGKSKHKRKKFHIKIFKVGKGYILQRLMTSGKSLMSTGTESCVHISSSLLCHDVLVTRDYQWQKLTTLRFQ